MIEYKGYTGVIEFDPSIDAFHGRVVRTTPQLHRAAATEAEASGMSLNAWVEAAITHVVEEHHPSMKRSRRSHSGRGGTSRKKA